MRSRVVVVGRRRTIAASGVGARRLRRQFRACAATHCRDDGTPVTRIGLARDVGEDMADGEEHDLVDPRDAAESAGLLYVTDDEPGITRHKAGKGFFYKMPD